MCFSSSNYLAEHENYVVDHQLWHKNGHLSLDIRKHGNFEDSKWGLCWWKEPSSPCSLDSSLSVSYFQKPLQVLHGGEEKGPPGWTSKALWFNIVLLCPKWHAVQQDNHMNWKREKSSVHSFMKPYFTRDCSFSQVVLSCIWVSQDLPFFPGSLWSFQLFTETHSGCVRVVTFSWLTDTWNYHIDRSVWQLILKKSIGSWMRPRNTGSAAWALNTLAYASSPWHAPTSSKCWKSQKAL